MIALDANVLLRLIVEDDEHQLTVARNLVNSQPTFVPLTVTMECEWVLRSFYKYGRDEVAIAIDALTDLEGMIFEQVEGVRWALSRLRTNADFADMIHVVQSRLGGASSFATFDGGVARAGGLNAPVPVETLG